MKSTQELEISIIENKTLLKYCFYVGVEFLSNDGQEITIYCSDVDDGSKDKRITLEELNDNFVIEDITKSDS